MNKIVFYLALIFITSGVFSQNYLIDFQSGDISNNLDSVLIVNYNNNDTLLIESNIQLLLSNSTSGIENQILGSNEYKIYPNPSYGDLIIDLGSFYLPQSINFTDLSGKVVFKESIKMAENNSISISNIPNGIYLLTITSSETQFSELIISNNNTKSWSALTTKYISTSETKDISYTPYFKSSVVNDITMLYNEGDILLITGYSGNMKTITSCTPSNDTTLTFNFYECADSSDYHYTVTEIGEQVWMAENLNYEASSGSSAYDNNENYVGIYGRIYNWETANRVCPNGWTLPSNDDLGELKLNSPEFQVPFDSKYWRGRWWTSTSFDDNNATARYWCENDEIAFFHGVSNSEYGIEENINKDVKLSVRCIKDYDYCNGETEVFIIVEEMPKFKGQEGLDKFKEWVAENIVISIEELNKYGSLRVFVQFTVHHSGRVVCVKVARECDSEYFNTEAVRVVESSPFWEPGKQRGQAVDVQITLPITISINE